MRRTNLAWNVESVGSYYGWSINAPENDVRRRRRPANPSPVKTLKEYGQREECMDGSLCTMTNGKIMFGDPFSHANSLDILQ